MCGAIDPPLDRAQGAVCGCLRFYHAQRCGFVFDALSAVLSETIGALGTRKTYGARNHKPTFTIAFMNQPTTGRLLRIFLRAFLVIVVLLIPIYTVSLSERIEVPAQWREIAVGDSHAQVRAKLRASGMGDTQCEWRGFEQSVRCTLLGQHHACGLEVRFDSDGARARVERVRIREPIYTGPFHMHARLRRNLQQSQASGMR